MNVFEQLLSGPTSLARGILQKLAGIVKSVGDLLILNLNKLAVNCLRAVKLTSLFALRLYGLLYLIPITRNLVIQFMPYI